MVLSELEMPPCKVVIKDELGNWQNGPEVRKDA